MRLHVVSLPHTQTTSEFNQCAFTALTRMFATMMTREGHEVVLYASERNEAECAELVSVITADEQDALFGHHDWFREHAYMYVDYDDQTPHWRLFNQRVGRQVLDRLRPGDIVCVPAGYTMHPVIDAVWRPGGNIVVEFCAGYSGVHAPFRAYPTHTWEAAVEGHWQGAATMNGRPLDAVIPHYADRAEFEAVNDASEDAPYALLSRMIDRKGYRHAIDATREIGARLLVAGVGGARPDDAHIDYFGFAGPVERAEILRTAQALFCPTVYYEPFGMIVVEAMMAGCPVITTDWGAFTETVRQGVDGYRCRSDRDFVRAALDVRGLDRREIRRHALATWALEAVAPAYTAWFDRVGAAVWAAGGFIPGLAGH